MSTDEKYKLIFDLLAKAKEGEGPDSDRLRNGIRKELQAGDKTFVTFLDLVESLQDIIPREKQRYNAAIKALSKTSGLSRQHILDATDSRLEELKHIEKAVFSALAGLFGDELKDMDSRLKMTRDELAELRRKIADLEKEEQELLSSMAGRQQESKAVEQAVGKIFTDVGAEITGIREKIEQFAAEGVSPQPITPPEPVESAKHDEAGEVAGITKKVEEVAVEEVSPQPITLPEFVESTTHDEAEGDMILEFPSRPKESKWAKKCPLCAGTMDLYTTEAMWKCYNCGNEEPEKNEAAAASELDNASESAAAAEPVPAAEPAPPPKPALADKSTPPPGLKPTPVATEPAAERPSSKKTCPVCRKQMILDVEARTWNCPFCSYLIREF